MIIKSFLKTAAWYGIATALNKGLMLIALPFLGTVLSLEEYGLWALSQIIISLGTPLFSLNSISGILREGVDDKKTGFTAFLKYSKILAIIAVITMAFLFFLPKTWLWYTVILVVIESFQSTLLGWYRARDRHINYFVVVILKLVALVGAVLLIKSEPSIEQLLFYQVVLGAFFILPFYLKELLDKANKTTSIVFKNILIFSVLLIPHGLAQWIMSGSDRIVIKYLLDDFELGKYSLAYSLAMVLMVANSGLALTVPNFIMKRYEAWTLENSKVKILFLYSVCALAINFIMIFTIDFFGQFIPLLSKVDIEVKRLMVWLMAGMYLLGIYFFYANILFYHRKSRIISFITLITAAINLIGTYIFVNKIGILGAAITTFASYLIYVLLFMYWACKIENNLLKHLKIELSIITLTTAVNFSLFFFL